MKIHLHTKKYDLENVSPPFFIDMFLVPLILFLVAGIFKTKINTKMDLRIYFGSLIDSFLFYYSSYELETRFSSGCESGLLAFYTLIYLVCMVLTYLISEILPRNIPNLITYLIIVISSLVVTKYEKSIYVVLKDFFLGFYSIGILFISSHYILVNIISSEAGIANYFFLQFPAMVLMLGLHFRGAFKEDLGTLFEVLRDRWLFYAFYLCLSLVVTVGTVVFTHRFGIVAVGLLSVTNFIFYRFINMVESGKYNILEILFFGVLYVVFMVTKVRFDKNSNYTPDPIISVQ
ncbi:hypothetical protein NGRA_0105 [Nosema granulosis]|uniref:Uncharacterized protein n=1 Tax=Nosema granulosis TaxID=83296 RepID=A0A9P6H3J9_9MICR|nr:hypothetical protein NGRA_0105 [Nosema granulosis]